MGCGESKVARKKKKKIEPEFKCKIIANDLDNTSRGIFLDKITNHRLYLAENCIDGDKKNKQLEDLRGAKGKIVACGFLHDGGAVLADEIRKLVILLQKDKDACNFLILKGEPTGLCVLGIDVFVTLSDKRVQHVTVVNDKIVHHDTLKTAQPCLGIASFNGDIAVGLKNGEVHIFDRKFQKHGGFFLPKFEDGRLLSPTSMMQFKQTLLVTDCFAHAVVRVTLKGEPLFVYTGMTSPRGTVVDNTGNIILAGYDDLTGEKIQHLSPRGEKIPSRMSTTDVAQFPYCIAFYRKYSKLLIAGESDRFETCILQMMETSNFQVEPETSHNVDATTDTISESMSLIDLENILHVTGDNEKTRGKHVIKLANHETEYDSVATEDKQSHVGTDKLNLEDLEKVPETTENGKKDAALASAKSSSTDVEKTTVTAAFARSSLTEVEKWPTAARSSVTVVDNAPVSKVKRASVVDNDKMPIPVEIPLPNEVPENTAVTVYDKTNKGVVKKVLITVREKKPKSENNNGPITVYEKTPNGDVEMTQTNSAVKIAPEIKTIADEVQKHIPRTMSPVQA